MQRVSLRSIEGNQELRPPLAFPAGFAIKDGWIAGDEATDQRLTVDIGLARRSSSYGLCVAGPDGKSRWIVISGLSGQRQIMESDEQCKAIMALLAQKRLPSDPAQVESGLHPS
jgi:hypothetical protein